MCIYARVFVVRDLVDISQISSKRVVLCIDTWKFLLLPRLHTSIHIKCIMKLMTYLFLSKESILNVRAETCDIQADVITSGSLVSHNKNDSWVFGFTRFIVAGVFICFGIRCWCSFNVNRNVALMRQLLIHLTLASGCWWLVSSVINMLRIIWPPWPPNSNICSQYK